MTASVIPHHAATTNIAIKYAKPTVVAFKMENIRKTSVVNNTNDAAAGIRSLRDKLISTIQRLDFKSLIISRLAFAPGAPVIPPPGCVPAPQRYRPVIGVRYCAHPRNG